MSFGLLLARLLSACGSFSADVVSSHRNAVSHSGQIAVPHVSCPLPGFYNQTKAQAKNTERNNKHTNSLSEGVVIQSVCLTFYVYDVLKYMVYFL